jgi:MinD superfamily P-loop ATPase
MSTMPTSKGPEYDGKVTARLVDTKRTRSVQRVASDTNIVDSAAGGGQMVFQALLAVPNAYENERRGTKLMRGP